jgi:hypothetical protein
VSRRLFVALALALGIGLATGVSPYASPAPDGLERVAVDKAFADEARPGADAPIAGYAFPGVENERVATGLAGFAGSLGVFALGYGLALLVRRRGAAAT